MDRVEFVKPLPDYSLLVEFTDGVRGVVTLKDRLFGPMFEPLKDVSFFERVFVDEFGAVCWPNGADLAPDGLYRRIQLSSQPALSAVSS